MAMQTRDRRALMLLGGAVALFLVLQLDFFQPDSGGSLAPSGDSLQVLEQNLQLAQVQARQRPLTEAELQAARKRLEQLESRLLDSEDAALAQAEMRSLIGDLLTAEGIAMKSSRFGSVELEEGDDYAAVPLLVDFTCAIEQFVNLMAAVANSQKLLASRDIRIQPENADVKSVRVRLTVAGYLPATRTPELTKRGGAL